MSGFDASSVSPSDAVVTLRSLPRRFAELVSPPSSEVGSSEVGSSSEGSSSEAGETAMLRRRAAALAEAGQAAEAIAAIGRDLRKVLVDDDAALDTATGTAGTTRYDGDPSTALDRLKGATTEVADLAAGTDGRAWTRTGVRAEGPVTAIDLLREAVQAGINHLHEAEAAT